jgi:hypothetical protein
MTTIRDKGRFPRTLLGVTACLVLALARAPYVDAQVSGCHPVINEFLGGTAVDYTEEFVELFNPCTTSFTLDGWVLQSRGALSGILTYNYSVLFYLQGVLQPGGYRVYGGPGFRGSSSGALLSGIPEFGAFIILQDRDNTLIDSTGTTSSFSTPSTAVTETSAPVPPLSPSPGTSVSRVPNGTDTNINGNDFKVTQPTPMAANAAPLSSVPITQPLGTTCHPVINEVLVGTSITPTEEFVEVFNPCAITFTVDGWTLVSRSATNTSPASSLDLPGTFLFPLRGVLESGGYLVYGGLGYRGPSNGPLGSALDANGAVGLRDTTLRLIDSVGFGQVSGNAFVEGTAAPVAPLSTSPGLSISRYANGVDSNNNGSDFKVTPPTPMAANATPLSSQPTQPVGTACHPVINEVLAGTAASASEEFVELFNPCPDTVNLDGSRVVYRDAASSTTVGSPDTAVLFMLQGVVLAAGGYQVYGGVGYRGPSNGALLRGIAEVPGAAVGLRDRNAYLMDSVLLGAIPNGSAFIEGGIAAPAPVLSSSPGISVSRVPNGTDTNVNGNDFKVTAATPMAANAPPLSSQPAPKKGGKK